MSNISYRVYGQGECFSGGTSIERGTLTLVGCSFTGETGLYSSTGSGPTGSDKVFTGKPFQPWSRKYKKQNRHLFFRKRKK